MALLFKDLSKINGKIQFFRRVRDWKGYGIVQQCGICEPLQSPTDVALGVDEKTVENCTNLLDVEITK